MKCRIVVHMGKASLYVSRPGEKMYITTDIELRPEQWLPDERIVVGRKNAGALTAYLNGLKDQVEEYALSSSYSLNKSFKDVRADIVSKLFGREIKSREKGNFAPFWARCVELKKTKGTKAIYVKTADRIAKFAEWESLNLQDITLDWIKRFEAYLYNEGLKTNTVSIYLRNLRAVINEALDEEIIVKYPFRKFRIRNEKTQKRSLSVEKLREVFAFKADEDKVRYQDIFKLIFYLIGINMTDLLHLTEIRDGRIEYRRAKTGRLYSIKVEPEALEIIEKYRGRKYLLNILDSWNDDGHGFLLKEDMELKRLGPYETGGHNHMKKTYHPIEPKLSTYWARHTWATIAASLDVPKETIAAALGHGGNTVTDIYIDFDRKKIDEANRKVIDYVLGI